MVSLSAKDVKQIFDNCDLNCMSNVDIWDEIVKACPLPNTRKVLRCVVPKEQTVERLKQFLENVFQLLISYYL